MRGGSGLQTLTVVLFTIVLCSDSISCAAARSASISRESVSAWLLHTAVMNGSIYNGTSQRGDLIGENWLRGEIALVIRQLCPDTRKAVCCFLCFKLGFFAKCSQLIDPRLGDCFALFDLVLAARCLSTPF